MAEEATTAAEEKAYCCGNSAQREATLIAKFDLGFSTIFLISFVSFLGVLLGSPDSFEDSADITAENATTDLSVFLQWPYAAQIGVLASLVLLHMLYVALGILLLLAAIKRHHKALLIWFGLTLGSYAAGIVLMIVTVIFLHDKVAVSIGLISVSLYKWYSLWIVKILMREITSVSEGEEYGETIEATGLDPDGGEAGIPLDKF